MSVIRRNLKTRRAKSLLFALLYFSFPTYSGGGKEGHFPDFLTWVTLGRGIRLRRTAPTHTPRCTDKHATLFKERRISNFSPFNTPLNPIFIEGRGTGVCPCHPAVACPECNLHIIPYSMLQGLYLPVSKSF